MKIIIKKIVHLSLNSTATNPDYYFFDVDMSEYGYAPIGEEQEIALEVPDNFNPIPLQIQALKKEQQKIKTEAEMKTMALDAKIQTLLCIEAPKSEVLEASA